MSDVSQVLDDDAVTRWLGEHSGALLDEVIEMLDIEAGLTSIISDPPDTPKS
ncbi:hypothetical protein [Streptomyces sp. NPDC017941]|uniref:hypothetical protein n=1 Tax=Streptomyces sp. NPDC017941 TaxID=3365018 RepID=UPI0037A932F2